MKKTYTYSYEKTCEVCGKPFITKRHATKICSEECVKIKISKSSSKYSPEQFANAVALKRNGTKTNDISNQTGISIPALKRYFKINQITLSKDQYKKNTIQYADRSYISTGQKKCAGCEQMKVFAEYSKNANTVDGHSYTCKDCDHITYLKNQDVVKARVNQYRKHNIDKIKELAKRRQEKYREEAIDRVTKWRLANIEKAREYSRKSKKKHQAQSNARTSMYRAIKKQATPKWLTETMRLQMESLYKECGKGYHVDHIVPLTSDLVCGLHVPWNLEIIPEVVNETKQNDFVDVYSHVCHQKKRRDLLLSEDIEAGCPINIKARDLILTMETFSNEHRLFIERYEWLGTIGYAPKWVFVARYNDWIGGVVMIGEPNAYSKNVPMEFQALIQRGACASWAPEHLNSRLLMYAVRHMISNSEKRIFYGYADYEAGEYGTIYQACGFKYLGNHFGRNLSFQMPSGKEVSNRYFTKTSTRRRYLKELGIPLEPAWLKSNKLLNIANIPTHIIEKLNIKAAQEKALCRQIEKDLKGKFVLIKAPTKKEENLLIELGNWLFFDPPKRPLF